MKALLLLILFLPLTVLAKPAVEYRGGVITEAELHRYAELLGTNFSDIIGVYRESTDPADRDLARSELEAAARELLFNRHYAQQAAEAGYTAPANYLQDIQSEYEECVGLAAEDRIARAITFESNEEWEMAFDRHLGGINLPERRDVSYIFRAFRTTDSPEDREQARQALEELRAEIESGSLSFGDAARLHSEAASAPEGGIIGSVTLDGPFNPLIKQAIFAVPSTGMSEVQTLHNGFYLFNVTAIYPAVEYTKKDLYPNQEFRRLLLDRVRQTAIMEDHQYAIELHPTAPNPRAALGRQRLAEGIEAPDCDLKRRLQVEQISGHLYYFSSALEEKIAPTEEEMREYYETNPQEMLGRGLWRLTRFTLVPGQDKELEIWNLSHAQELAQEIRDALAEGASAASILSRFEPRGLRMESHEGWVHGTDHAGADQELLSLEAGAYSSVFHGEGGAFFFQLLERRPLPKLTFEESRPYIQRVMSYQAREKAKKDAAIHLMEELGAVELWREQSPKE